MKASAMISYGDPPLMEAAEVDPPLQWTSGVVGDHLVQQKTITERYDLLSHY